MAYQDRSLTDLKVRLNTMLRNIVVSTFPDAEITEALSSAINDDESVFIIDRDSSLTTQNVAGTNLFQYSYPLPSNYESIYEVRIDIGGNGLGFPIGVESYRVTAGNLEFLKFLPSGKPLYLYGKHKLTDSDLIPQYLQKYILHNAAVYVMELLLAGKMTRFLKNATTVSELQMAMAHHQSMAAMYHSKLPNRRGVNL